MPVFVVYRKASPSTMTRLLPSYLAREILETSRSVLLVLFVSVVSNALGRVLAGFADGDIPRLPLWRVLFGQSVNLLSLLLPIAFFLGIIFTFGRMYKDHEIVVMHACGIGYRDFYRPLLIELVPFFALRIYTRLWFGSQVLTSGAEAIERGPDQDQV